MDTNKQNLIEFEQNKGNKKHPTQEKDIFRTMILTATYEIKTGKVSAKFEKLRDFESDNLFTKILENKLLFLFFLSVLLNFIFNFYGGVFRLFGFTEFK